MKRYAQMILIGLLALGLLVAAGCGTKSAEKTTSDNAAAPAAGSSESVDGLTKDNPLKVNQADKSVTFLAQVNGKYFLEPTRHGAVFADGANGEKAIFRAFATPENFYNALTEIGAKAGENMTMENKDKTNVSGDAFDITVNWTGAKNAVKFDQAVKDSNGNPIDIRFGGNLKNAQEKKTGCLICLDSCPVGITSNAAYKYGAVESTKEVGFTANKEVLPADGTYVAITMKIK
ncbi:MAG: YdjY domain-containing protein [Syntrophomonadaceae bacterium]|nr:YdjY domain-containing protein [Syntrophomonadaceae bacterium]